MNGKWLLSTVQAIISGEINPELPHAINNVTPQHIALAHFLAVFKPFAFAFPFNRALMRQRAAHLFFLRKGAPMLFEFATPTGYVVRFKLSVFLLVLLFCLVPS
jgi:hypothetical protein